MGFQILPNNLGLGSVFNQISGPLGSLFSSSTPANLVYPSDLASNPAMCHAIQFSIYDYTTTFEETVNKTLKTVAGTISNLNQNVNLENVNQFSNAAGTKIVGFVDNVVTRKEDESNFDFAKRQTAAAGETIGGALNTIGPLFQKPTYRPKQKENSLATVSLYMPDSLTISHDANYSDISMTETLSTAGIIANAYSDTKNMKDKANFLAQSGYGKTFAAMKAGELLNGKLGINGDNVKDVLKNAMGIYTNPQIQLIYKGINLRDFSLSFVFTPKSSQEAKTAKDIIDTFTFYSVPGKSSALAGESGQFLTPPQLMTIKFLFLGQNGIAGSISDIFSSALSNLGLNSLITSNPTETIKNGKEAKIMTVQECVLRSVSVDYAPNGWAAFNDGYPVQTTMTLNFQETEIMTKDKVNNSGVANNFKGANFLGSSSVADAVEKLGGTSKDFMTGSNGFGNFGE
jgi:hypothetical protein